MNQDQTLELFMENELMFYVSFVAKEMITLSIKFKNSDKYRELW